MGELIIWGLLPVVALITTLTLGKCLQWVRLMEKSAESYSPLLKVIAYVGLALVVLNFVVWHITWLLMMIGNILM